jgi:SAM-dependent methyltransferase
MKKCDLCNSELQNDTDYLNEWNHNLFENKSLLICMNCGFSQINPKLTDNDLNNYYENIYRSKNSPMYIDFNSYFLDKHTSDFRSISQLLLGRQYVSNKKEYSFLDIGPGPGFSLISAKKIFQNVKLSVIESNSHAKNFYKKFFKDLSIYKNLNEIKNEIDVILMSHSLEHFDINDMPALFQDMHNILADDGIVIIEVPHADLRNASFLSKRKNDTPHLSFFSLDSLTKFVNKSKFNIRFINTVGPLLLDTYSEEINEGKEQNSTLSRNGSNIYKIIKKIIKKISNYFGFYGYLKKINVILNTTEEPYSNINFQYGGNRDCIRCVLKKKF